MIRKIVITGLITTNILACCCPGYVKGQINAVDRHFKQINDNNIDEVELLTEKFKLLNEGYLNDMIAPLNSKQLDSLKKLNLVNLANVNGFYSAEARIEKNHYLVLLEHNDIIKKLNKKIEENANESTLEAKIKNLELQKELVQCEQQMNDLISKGGKELNAP